jgi:hypothetical protein
MHQRQFSAATNHARAIARRWRDYIKGERSEVVRDDSPYASLWQLHYPLGLAYLHAAFIHGGNWEVQTLFESPPISSIHWLVGYDENTTRHEHLVLPLACTHATIPQGYERHAEYTLGPIAFYALLGHNLVHDGVYDVERHWQNAMHWREDGLTIFTTKLGQVALSYRVRLDDAQLAKSLADALSAAPTLSVHAHASGDELEVLAADDATILTSFETDPMSCPTAP